MYVPVLSGFRAPPSGEGEGSSTPSAVYKRYKLSEEKTFASLFHPEKDSILRLVGLGGTKGKGCRRGCRAHASVRRFSPGELSAARTSPLCSRQVDQFLNKTGKFAIPGYPQKLGFLLWGPPGTGKTSLIKALAQHTKRSIISVPLSKISTNQELMDIVFDSKLTVQNSSDNAVSLPFHKTIFVMEDVDAASNGEQRALGSRFAHAACCWRAAALLMWHAS